MPQSDFSDYLSEICKRIKSKPRREEVMEELLCHLEDNFERNLAVGMTEEEARLNAITKMGDSEKLAYRLSAVNSASPLQSMSSAFFSLIAGYICMDFVFKGIVQDVLFYLGAAFMLSALLRMRKMNNRTEYSFHIFNFSVIARLALYFMKLGRELNVYLECGLAAAVFILQGLFWFFLLTGLYRYCEPYLKEDGKAPHLYFCGVYQLLLSFVSAFFVAFSEGEDVDFTSFILPCFIIFVYFYCTVQLIRMRNILWDADSEYGILPNDKKHFAVFLSVIAVIVGAVLIFNYASSTMSPEKTELIIHDVSETEQVKADKVRQKMLSWDVEPQIVEDLPDSEILKYKDAEFVTWGADGGSLGGLQQNYGASSDIYYYWFFIPDKEYKGNYEVRLLCYIESHYADTVKSFFRKGFYYMPWGKGIYPLNYEDILNGSYISIVTDENGKKYNAEPFFTYNLMDFDGGYPTDYPKGFEYREEKGQRVYYATQIGVTNLHDTVTLCGATVRQRWFSTLNYYTTADYIGTVMHDGTATVKGGDNYPYAYRLHNIGTGNLQQEDIAKLKNNSLEYEGWYPKEY